VDAVAKKVKFSFSGITVNRRYTYAAFPQTSLREIILTFLDYGASPP
jgi:hypothetical protein